MSCRCRRDPRCAASALAALLALALAPGASAATSTVRTYEVRGRPSLELSVPIRWRETVSWQDGRPTLRFEPDRGRSFAMVVTPVLPAGEMVRPRGDDVRALVEESARAALGVAAGTDLGVVPLESRGGVGWFFTVEDRKELRPAPPDTWPVMTQGALALEPYLVTATILTEERGSDERTLALEVLRSARATAGPPEAWRTAPPEPEPGGWGEAYSLEVPEGFAMRAESPLRLEHEESGASLVVRVEDRDSTVPEEARRLRAEQERRSPEAWRQGARRSFERDGVPALDIELVDERLGVSTRHLVLLGHGRVVTATWEVASRHEGRAASLREALLGSLRLLPRPAPAEPG